MSTGIFLKGQLLDNAHQGTLALGPCRVYSIYWQAAVAGGVVELLDGTGGNELIVFTLPAAASAGSINLVDNGVKFTTGVWVNALPAGSSITLFYDPPMATV